MEKIKFNEKKENATKIVSFKMIIKYFCAYLEKEMESTSEDHDDIEFDSSSCETCGSHGYVNVPVNCECGRTHYIKLRSW